MQLSWTQSRKNEFYMSYILQMREKSTHPEEILQVGIRSLLVENTDSYATTSKRVTEIMVIKYERMVDNRLCPSSVCVAVQRLELYIPFGVGVPSRRYISVICWLFQQLIITGPCLLWILVCPHLRTVEWKKELCYAFFFKSAHINRHDFLFTEGYLDYVMFLK